MIVYVHIIISFNTYIIKHASTYVFLTLLIVDLMWQVGICLKTINLLYIIYCINWGIQKTAILHVYVSFFACQFSHMYLYSIYDFFRLFLLICSSWPKWMIILYFIIRFIIKDTIFKTLHINEKHKSYSSYAYSLEFKNDFFFS